MLAAVSEIEKYLIVGRNQAGLARAKAEGKTLGRPFRPTQEQGKAKVNGHASHQSVSSLAKLNGVSRATVLTVVFPARDAGADVAQLKADSSGLRLHAWAGGKQP